MESSKLAYYYQLLLNSISGLLDDLDANSAPIEAKKSMMDVLNICKDDYKIRFGRYDEIDKGNRGENE